MNTLLTVERFKFAADWTLSRLLVNQKLDGFTVEDEMRVQKVHGETAIPFGVYPLGLRQSPKFSSSFLWSESNQKLIDAKDKVKFPKITDWSSHELIWIKDVPGFQYVLLHWGNTDDDTEGCLIVGSSIGVIGGQEGVLNSRKYYVNLYQRIYPMIKSGQFTIEYKKAA